ncbi:MAG: TetR/AcrR family transcriptional regulator [bacterium]|nr:TetR/AcrR family transcriptional regulator [bacterium]
MSRNKYPEVTVKKILDVAQNLFLEKGYEATSIQDIISGLGGLSKGAVYHHFKSKEEIFNAVGDRFNEQIIIDLRAIRDDPSLNGYEKLKKMFRISLASSERDIVYTVAPNLMDNPKLLAMQVNEIFSDVAPHFVQPIIEQGQRDGSIQTDYPKELAEVVSLLTNIWLNPFVVCSNLEEMQKRVCFFHELLKTQGLELLDDDMMESYTRYCKVILAQT